MSADAPSVSDALLDTLKEGAEVAALAMGADQTPQLLLASTLLLLLLDDHGCIRHPLARQLLANGALNVVTQLMATVIQRTRADLVPDTIHTVRGLHPCVLDSLQVWWADEFNFLASGLHRS